MRVGAVIDEIAESQNVEGHMTIGTTTPTRTDAEIQRDVIEELKWEPRVNPSEIGVIVKDGIVTLTGWVDSYVKRWAAEDAALRVKGVKAVANDVEVRLSPQDERTDIDIAADVTRALETDALIPAGKVQVTVSKGWVTMKGTVDWQFQREDAERAARRIRGVKGVTNLLTIASRPTPAEIRKKIQEALLRDARTDASRITVEIEDNKVILKGAVRSWAEREEAERQAWSAPGVTAVENRIQVTF